MKDKKEMIKKFLKQSKMASTGKIASMIKANQYVTEKHLSELESSGEVKKIKAPNATYWELKQ